jgi:hypothetical protein
MEFSTHKKKGKSKGIRKNNDANNLIEIVRIEAELGAPIPVETFTRMKTRSMTRSNLLSKLSIDSSIDPSNDRSKETLVRALTNGPPPIYEGLLRALTNPERSEGPDGIVMSDGSAVEPVLNLRSCRLVQLIILDLRLGMCIQELLQKNKYASQIAIDYGINIDDPRGIISPMWRGLLEYTREDGSLLRKKLQAFYAYNNANVMSDRVEINLSNYGNYFGFNMPGIRAMGIVTKGVIFHFFTYYVYSNEAIIQYNANGSDELSARYTERSITLEDIHLYIRSVHNRDLARSVQLEHAVIKQVSDTSIKDLESLIGQITEFTGYKDETEKEEDIAYATASLSEAINLLSSESRTNITIEKVVCKVLDVYHRFYFMIGADKTTTSMIENADGDEEPVTCNRDAGKTIELAGHLYQYGTPYFFPTAPQELVNGSIEQFKIKYPLLNDALDPCYQTHSTPPTVIAESHTGSASEGGSNTRKRKKTKTKTKRLKPRKI